MPLEIDTKQFACVFEFKEVSDAGTFTGHAAVFNNVDLGGDKILPAAFAHTIKETGGRWPVLNGHRQDQLIGFSTGAEEDKKGLLVAGEFTLDSQLGANAYASAKHAARVKAPVGLSIGYSPRKDGVEYDEAAGIRLLKSLNVWEFSLAPVPMNPRARMDRVKAVSTLREAEDFLRSMGLTGDEARQFISLCKVERDAKPGTVPSERDAKEEQAKRAAEAFMSEARMAILLNAL